MRRFATAALLALCLACIAAVQPARADQLLLFDYVGFDYEYPDNDGSDFGGLTNGYNGVGELPFIDSSIPTNYADNQYTYFLTGLTATSRTDIAGYAVIEYSAGTLAVYEDPKSGGTPFDYGTNPPAGSAPATFTDGTAILTFSVDQFRIVVNTVTGAGSYDSEVQLTGGTLAGFVPAPQKGWQFAGVTGRSVTIPLGFVHQVDGQVYLTDPTPAR